MVYHKDNMKKTLLSFLLMDIFMSLPVISLDAEIELVLNTNLLNNLQSEVKIRIEFVVFS